MAVSQIATVGHGLCTDPGIASVAPLNPNGLCNRLSQIAAVGIPYGVELPLENRECGTARGGTFHSSAIPAV